MSSHVKWTKEAIVTFNQNLDYLSKGWNLSTINTFLDRVDEVIEHISLNPDIYPVYRSSDSIRRCVLNKHITLFYRVKGESIDIITFWNTHQNPDNLKL